VCQEIPVRVRERRPPIEDCRSGGGESHLEENADAYEIESLTLLQNIADMQQQAKEAEV
jgi:hypothetical protein